MFLTAFMKPLPAQDLKTVNHVRQAPGTCEFPGELSFQQEMTEMTQRFDELYIRRGEHQQIVAYYKKLVVHVYQKLRALQEERNGAEPASKICSTETKTVPATKDPQPGFSNVVKVDFRRPHRLGSERSS